MVVFVKEKARNYRSGKCFTVIVLVFDIWYKGTYIHILYNTMYSRPFQNQLGENSQVADVSFCTCRLQVSFHESLLHRMSILLS